MPNPTAVLIFLVALVVIVIAYKGTQANFLAAVLGHAPSGTGLVGSSQNAPSNQSPSASPGGIGSPWSYLNPFTWVPTLPGVSLLSVQTPNPAVGTPGMVTT